MSVYSGPEISNDGLILCLDAANSKSYPGSGTAWNDLSGGVNNGTLVNGVAYSNTNGGILTFDGSNDYIELLSPSNKWAWTPSGAGKNTLSLEMFVKSTDTGGRFFCKPWNGSGEYNYWLTTDGWYSRVGAQEHNQTFSSLTTGNWEHIVCIITPTQKAVYRNGQINAAFTNHNTTNNTPASGNGDIPLAIMTLYPYGTGTWDYPNFSESGNISKFKIYNRALSATEIQQNFNAHRGRFNI